jgi:hypothetical protein
VCLFDSYWTAKNAMRLGTFLGFSFLTYQFILPRVAPNYITGFWEKNQAIIQGSDPYRRSIPSFPTPLFIGADQQHQIGVGVRSDTAQLTFAKPAIYQIEYITNVYLSSRRGEVNKIPVDVEVARLDLLLMKNDVEVIHRVEIDATSRATPIHTRVMGKFEAGDRIALYAATVHINGVVDENLNAEVIVDTYSFLVAESEYQM